MTRKKPSKRKIREKINLKLGVSQPEKWRNGRIKIFKLEEFENIARFYPYVHFYILKK